MRKEKPRKIGKTPPPGWPTENEWNVIEKKLNRSKPSKTLPANAGPVDRIKHELCSHFVRYCHEKKISQRELAVILSINESRISEIVHYHHGRFTIDKLLELLSVIKPKLKLNVA